MKNIREILRLSNETDLSLRKIAISVKSTHVSVSSIIERARKLGLQYPIPPEMDDSTLEKMLYPKAENPKKARLEPDMEYIHKELKRKHVTLKLLWNEYKDSYPEGLMYTQFCDRYRQWNKKLDVCLRQNHKAGEKTFVDWVGDKIPIYDRNGEIREAHVFIAALGASSYTYAEAFMTEAMPEWIAGHVHSFIFFKGLTEIIVPDNAKTGVKTPSYYEPELTITYQEMAAHYGTVVIPARVAKPKDKAKVENAVQVAERWIMAAIRNHKFFSLTELNQCIWEKLEKLNAEPFQKMDGSRYSLYESIDKPALKALPACHYEYAQWKKASVNIDYHVEFDKNYYSTPFQLVKQEVEIRATSTVVEVYFKGNRVASHKRSYRKYEYVTEPAHRPLSHQKHLEWTPARLLEWAGSVGENTRKLVDGIFQRKAHVEQGYRSCLGIMRLGKAYSNERLEKASERAIRYGSYSYKSLKLILEKGLDTVEKKTQPKTMIPEHENIRGKEYYNENGGEQDAYTTYN